MFSGKDRYSFVNLKTWTKIYKKRIVHKAVTCEELGDCIQPERREPAIFFTRLHFDPPVSFYWVVARHRHNVSL